MLLLLLLMKNIDGGVRSGLLLFVWQVDAGCWLQMCMCVFDDLDLAEGRIWPWYTRDGCGWDGVWGVEREKRERERSRSEGARKEKKRRGYSLTYCQ